MAPHRRNIGASRRQRREEEGEEEGSVGGRLEDDSLSEGSDFSQQEDDDADGESNDGSEDETTTTPQTDQVNGQVNDRVSQPEQHSERRDDNSPGKQGQDSKRVGYRGHGERVKTVRGHRSSCGGPFRQHGGTAGLS